jgi:xylulose-5-phosphate/fructose-6-phosphate phosphoketolase
MPDVAMARAGGVSTLEVLPAVTILNCCLPTFKVQSVNVVELMRMYCPDKHPHEVRLNLH